MPPASLPALAAIRPGPSRPKKAKTRARRGLSRAGRRGRPRVADLMRRMIGGTRTAIYLSSGGVHRGRVYSVLAEKPETPAPAARENRLEHIVDRDHAQHPLLLVCDRDGGEVVIGHQPCHLLEGRVGGRHGRSEERRG